MELNWNNQVYQDQYQQPPIQNQQQQLQQQMPNVYQSNVNNLINEYDIEKSLDNNKPSIKKYIVLFVLIVIVYFIFSLDAIKNSIGMILTCINPQENGLVKPIGFLSYGILISFIIVFILFLLERYNIVNY